jgi:hypothetical protein
MRGIHVSPLADEGLVQVRPLGVDLQDQVHFPAARPFLDALLAPDRRLDGVVPFDVDEALQAIALGKALDETFAMLMRAVR